jgi:hypothetical protein
MTTTITLNTKDYGPTGFEVELSPKGEVLKVASSASLLPETVFRITYGDRWESAREHFQRLADNLAYRVEAAAWINDVLPEYKLLRRAFRKSSPETAPNGGADAPLYSRRATFWIAHPNARPGLFLQKKSYSGFREIASLLKTGKADAEALEPWLFSLINLLQDVQDRSMVYKLIALLSTATSSEFIFSELERPGRHPYATGLLEAAEELAFPENNKRILGLYNSLSKELGQTRNYLKVIRCLRGKDVHQILLAILHKYSSLAPEVLEALHSSGHPAPGAAIRERFDQEENLFMLDLLAELIDAEPEGIRVSLQDMNAKINTPVLNAAAPVTWPQMLWPNWTKLILNTTQEEFFKIIDHYLHTDQAWLQRNALLQLDVWVRAQVNAPSVSLPIEKRMRELVFSRYEKVYTTTLSITEQIFDQLAEPELMLDAVLAHAPTSSYRLMNVAVLKKAAKHPKLRERQLHGLRAAFSQVSSIDEIVQLERFIPYLSFLHYKLQLNSAAKRSRRNLGIPHRDSSTKW